MKSLEPTSFDVRVAVSQVTETGADWQTARRFADAANRFEHGAVACRVMAGIVLLELREAHGTNQGTRNDLSATSPHAAEKLNWPDLVKRELGVSEDSAGRWMKMAAAAMPRLQSGEAGEVFRQLLEIPITRLSDKQSAALTTAVERLVDGRSQLDFMESLGLIAPPPPKGGDREWKAFLEARHPELIQDGKVPARGKAGKDSKAIKAEFSKWLNDRMKPRTAKEKHEAARGLLSQIEDVLGAAVRNALLGTLPPQEFQGVEALTTQWCEKLKALASPSRN